jgi:hypothetical protein
MQAVLGKHAFAELKRIYLLIERGFLSCDARFPN